MKSTNRYRTTSRGLTRKEAAAYLCMSLSTLKRLIKERVIEEEKPSPRKRVIRQSFLDSYRERVTS